MATPPKGYRVTRKRAEELQSQIDRLEGRVDELVSRLERAESRTVAAALLVRARIAAELQALKDADL